MYEQICKLTNNNDNNDNDNNNNNEIKADA